MNNYLLKRGIVIFLLFLTLILTCFCQGATAHPEEEFSLLRMYYSEEELVVTPSRNPKTLSQTAENVTVITTDEIEAMNAHTLADVLNNIPGVQMDIKGGPGTATFHHIQGSDFHHVLVVMDGVPLNNLANGIVDFGSLPVQNIGRIEIIKGPASSSWGSSLGGVINIITKPAGIMEKPTGSIFQSGGEKKTLDSRVELSDKARIFGYYLLAENLFSDGLRPANAIDKKNLYTKLRWDLGERANLLFTLGHSIGERVSAEFPEYDEVDSNDFEYLFSSLCLNYFLNNKFDIKLSFWTSRQNVELFTNQVSTGLELYKTNYKDSLYGGSTLLRWKNKAHSLVLGADFENGELKSNSIVDEKQGLEKRAIFANDTIVINRFSLTPGIRYDHISKQGNFVSPSLGFTFAMTKKTLFRAYFAKGFTPIPLTRIYIDNPRFVANKDLKAEKVTSIQAGIESTSLKYVWTKISVFRHDMNQEEKRQGLEVEIKTSPVFHT